jgi:hypothetical protein
MTLSRQSRTKGVDGQRAARKVPAPSPAGDGSTLAPAPAHSSKSSRETVKSANGSDASVGPKAQSGRAGAHRRRGRHPPVGGDRPQESSNRTESRFRFLNLVEVTNPHLMPAREIGAVLLLFAATLGLYLLLFAAVAVVAIIMFDCLVSTLAAHSSQLQRLNPGDFRTTVLGVWGFTSLALAARTVNRWPHRGKKVPSSTKQNDDEE